VKRGCGQRVGRGCGNAFEEAATVHASTLAQLAPVGQCGGTPGGGHSPDGPKALHVKLEGTKLRRGTFDLN
jgi:hypothetical protein